MGHKQKGQLTRSEIFGTYKGALKRIFRKEERQAEKKEIKNQWMEKYEQPLDMEYPVIKMNSCTMCGTPVKEGEKLCDTHQHEFNNSQYR